MSSGGAAIQAIVREIALKSCGTGFPPSVANSTSTPIGTTQTHRNGAATDSTSLPSRGKRGCTTAPKIGKAPNTDIQTKLMRAIPTKNPVATASHRIRGGRIRSLPIFKASSLTAPTSFVDAMIYKYSHISIIVAGQLGHRPITAISFSYGWFRPRESAISFVTFQGAPYNDA